MFQGVYAFAPALHTQVLWKMKVIKTFIITALLFFPKIQLTVHKRFKLSAAVFLYTCTLRLQETFIGIISSRSARALVGFVEVTWHGKRFSFVRGKIGGKWKMLEQTLQVARSLWVRKKEFLSTECEKRQRKTIVNNPRARCVNKMINHNYDVTN